MMKSCFGGLNILIMLYPVLCLEDNSLCKIGNPQKCSNVPGLFCSYEYNVISSGSCEFDSGLCSYTQRCTGNGSLPWENVNGSAEMQGQSGLYDSYSVLGSPVIYIPCNSKLIINVTIANPSQLEIALIKNNASCILREQKFVAIEENVNESLLIEGPAYIEIHFRGFNGGGSPTNISYVRLHSVQLTTAINCTDQNSQHTTWQPVSSSSESTLTANSTTESSSKADSPHTTGQSISSSSESTLTANSTTQNNSKADSSTIGAIVGPIMAVLAIVAVIIGVIAWKKRSHHNRNEDSTKKHSHQQSNSVKDLRTVNNQFDVINKVGSSTVDESESTNISSNRNNVPYSPIGFEPHDTHSYDRIPDGGHSEKTRFQESGQMVDTLKKPRFQESGHYDLIKSHADTNAFMGGKVTSNLNRMNLTKMKTGAPVYSVVQKNRHNPKISDESFTDDYNRIDLDNHTTGNESGAAALNVYNKLKSPLYDVPPSSKIKSLKPAMDTPQDDYNKLDYKENLRDTPQDDYNKRDYKQNLCDRPADNGHETLDECDSKLNAYSSLGNSTDTYTRVQSGNKDKVIASDYDHIV